MLRVKYIDEIRVANHVGKRVTAYLSPSEYVLHMGGA